MKHEYTPTTVRVRALLATAAVILSTTIVGLVGSLANHYSDQVYLAGGERTAVAGLR